MDPISAMRLAGAGGMYPAQAPAVQPGKIPTQELQSLGDIATPQMESAAPSGVQGRSFADFLGQMVRDVNAKQAHASETVNGVLSGQNVPLHQAMISIEEASVSFQLMVEVRNKLLESYQELMRMQI
jgi:flagellar hook-basal body complex protein FliE